MKKIFLLFAVFQSAIFAQIFTRQDVDICNSKFDIAVRENLSSKPIGDVVVEIGKSFIGLDYEAHTLEEGDSEQVVIHLSGLDCYTFFESSLALARCIKLGDTDFDSYLKQIEWLRYRNGEAGDYATRLHYAVDWLFDNQKRKNIKDITKAIGGIPFDKKVNFMSEHPESYKRLKDSPEEVEKIKKIEAEINKRKYYYIPQDSIASVESGIRNGDIIFCATSYKGLMIGHTGIAVKEPDGRIHFMHAPIQGKKVQISEQPLADYIKAVKKHIGIMALRPLEPGE